MKYRNIFDYLFHARERGIITEQFFKAYLLLIFAEFYEDRSIFPRYPYHTL